MQACGKFIIFMTRNYEQYRYSLIKIDFTIFIRILNKKGRIFPPGKTIF